MEAYFVSPLLAGARLHFGESGGNLSCLFASSNPNKKGRGIAASTSMDVSRVVHRMWRSRN